jgi:zinc and cadmium transporter
MAGSWSVLMGDSIHAFGDGLLVAAACLADVQLGVAATVAVLAHEVPHHMGDLVVLQQGLGQPRSALIKLCMAGGVTVLGGLVGYSLIAGHEEWLPFWLTLASSSYIYVALADLIPQLQKRLSANATVAQIGWLFAGIALVTGVTQLGHMH